MPDWREILSRDGPAAWRTAYRLLGNRADADECFQEACMAAPGRYRGANWYTTGKVCFSAWPSHGRWIV